MSNTIGGRILQARGIIGLGQEEAALKMGVSRATLWNWETGKTIPSSKDLEAIVKVLRCDLTWLVTGREPESFHYDQHTDDSLGEPSLQPWLDDPDEHAEMQPTSEEIEKLRQIRLKGVFRGGRLFWRQALESLRREAPAKAEAPVVKPAANNKVKVGM